MTTQTDTAPLSAEELAKALRASALSANLRNSFYLPKAADALDALSARVKELEAENKRLKIKCASWKSLYERFAGHLRRAYNVAVKAGGAARHGEFDTAEAITDVVGSRDDWKARATQAEALLSDLCRLTGEDSPAAAVSVVATMLHGADAQAYGGVLRAYAEERTARTKAEAERDEFRNKLMDADADRLRLIDEKAELIAALSASQAREAGMREALRRARPLVALFADERRWEDHQPDGPGTEHGWYLNVSEAGCPAATDTAAEALAAIDAALSPAQPAQDRIAAAVAFIDRNGPTPGTDRFEGPEVTGPAQGADIARELAELIAIPHTEPGWMTKRNALLAKARSAGLLTTETEGSNG
ncbi:hypothetical protein GAY31_19665 [Azospirillum brasilense]|nr:hypothetical protein [Azospirillum brasilense]